MLPDAENTSRHVVVMNRRYHDGLAAFKNRCTDYSTIQQFVTRVFREDVAGIRSYLQSKQQVRVADIGVGDGTITKHLAETLLDNFSGRVELDVVEPTDDYASQTNARLAPLYGDRFETNFIKLGSEGHFILPCSNFYHVVFASHSLHLIPLNTIPNIGESVMPGGYVIVVIGAHGSIMSALKDFFAPKPAITGEDVLRHMSENFTARRFETTRFSIPSFLDLRGIELPEMKEVLTEEAKNILSLMFQKDIDEISQEKYAVARRMIIERLQNGMLRLDNDGFLFCVK